MTDPTQHTLVLVLGSWFESLVCVPEGPRTFENVRTNGACLSLEAVEANTYRLRITHPAYQASLAAYRCPCCDELGGFCVEQFMGDPGAAVRWVRDHRRGVVEPIHAVLH
ncbi:MAG: hypothetical protein CMN30_31170 [Sandaracinus sp.]|nr:hypothetical protein [Sandaracinus sp.]